MIQIIEILSRAKQGVTRPFLCKANDEKFYYVKGIGSHAGHRSLLAEWIAGNLAEAFGLPIAPFQVVYVAPALLEVQPKWSSLGSGAAFGSQVLSFNQELQWKQLNFIPSNLQQDILVFDWWVNNEDRNLTEKGGNPNLLWDTQQKKLTVIDHNVAFDPKFSLKSFFENHVFRNQYASVFEDCVARLNYVDRMRTAFTAFDKACDNSPIEWWWIDQGVPCSFNKTDVLQLLERFEDQSFWRVRQ